MQQSRFGLPRSPLAALRAPGVALCLIASACSPAFSDSGSGAPTDLVGKKDVANAIVVSDVHASLDQVTGKLVNHTATPLRDVQLMFQHTWLWNDERHPGKDNPGRTEFYLVMESVPANGEISFEYHPNPPLAKRTDGRFETRVEVLGFTEAAN